MSGLMTCYSQPPRDAEAGKSPHGDPSAVSAFPRFEPPVWGKGGMFRIVSSLYIQRGDICVWPRSCFPLHPRRQRLNHMWHALAVVSVWTLVTIAHGEHVIMKKDVLFVAL